MYNEGNSDNIDGDYGSTFEPTQQPKKKTEVTASGGIDWLISAVTGLITVIIGWVLIPAVGWRVDSAVAGILSGTSFDTTMWSAATNPDIPSGVAFWGTVSSFVVVGALWIFFAFIIKMLIGMRNRQEGL